MLNTIYIKNNTNKLSHCLSQLIIFSNQSESLNSWGSQYQMLSFDINISQEMSQRLYLRVGKNMSNQCSKITFLLELRKQRYKTTKERNQFPNFALTWKLFEFLNNIKYFNSCCWTETLGGGLDTSYLMTSDSFNKSKVILLDFVHS